MLCDCSWNSLIQWLQVWVQTTTSYPIEFPSMWALVALYNSSNNSENHVTSIRNYDYSNKTVYLCSTYKPATASVIAFGI